jgi:nitrite reductase/ring-hydroxylating ferredoxin subunit
MRAAEAMAREIDTERVLCALEEIPENGSRGFTVGTGDWPLRGFLVRMRDEVRGYVNNCPHAGHPLNLQPHRFLTHDDSLILCNSHGALFEKGTGYCVAGPCAGASLESIAVEVIDGYVLLKEVDSL